MKLAGGVSKLICRCGASMNEDESHYYGTCEECAREEWDKVRHWKAMRDDIALEAEALQGKRVLH